MSEPKKVDRRKFIYAGLGTVALIAIGAAAYVAMNPPVVTKTVPTTSVVTTTVPTTSVITTTSVATTTVPVTSTMTTTPSAPAKTLIVDQLHEPTGLDPQHATATYGESVRVITLIFEPYFVYDYRELPKPVLKPNLFISYNVNSDSTVWTFTLKRGVKFHDGEPFNASAVKYSMERAKNKDLGFAFLPIIQNMTVEVISDDKVSFKFPQPVPNLLELLAQPQFSPVSPKSAEKWGITDFKEHPVGTGPFKFVSWTKGVEIVLERFDEYHGGPEFFGHIGPARVNKIVFRGVTDNTTKFNDIVTGNCDMITSPAALNPSDYRRLPNYIYTLSVPSASEVYLFFNVEKVGDPNIRKAIASLIDRETWAAKLTYNTSVPVYAGFVATTNLGYDPSIADLVPKYNLEAASKYMAAAGYTKGADGKYYKDGKPLTINFLSISAYKDTLEAFTTSLNAFGIDAKLSILDTPTLFSRIQNGDYDMAMCGAGSFVTSDTARLFFTDTGLYNTRFQKINPEVGALIQKALNAKDVNELGETWKTLDKINVENCVVLAVYTLPHIYVLGRWVSGFIAMPELICAPYVWLDVDIDYQLKRASLSK
jgi:peptide/nickel transport system substrate-binding protein